MALTLTIKGQRDLQPTANALRGGKGVLRRELTKAFKDAGADTLRRVKKNVETMPIRGYRTGRQPRFTEQMPGTHIRRRISRVTELEVSTSTVDPRVRFRVRTDRLGDASEVPWHFESGKIFRHPIMGKDKEGNWRGGAGQSGKPWFYAEIRSDQAVFVAKCDAAIQRTIDKIERG
jgi:hypothetical protein